MIAVFNLLKEALPSFKSVADSPFVMMSSSVGPITERRIEQRSDIYLYITTRYIT